MSAAAMCRIAASMLLLALLGPGSAAAHELRPVSLDIRQAEGLHYRVVLRVPESVAADIRPVVRWPAGCEAIGASLLRCAQALPGQELHIEWPLYNPSVTTLVRYQPREGAVVAAVLPPETTAWRVPAEATRAGVMRGYFTLGVEHILGGIDHLLFVAGLLLLARGFRPLLLAVTGFTLGHSLTLSLAALGYVRVPIPPTEAAIALSLLFLAREALRPPEASLLRRLPLLVSAAFGLLHGLGFAAALGEAGLPGREIAWALLFFNLGVEAGQLAFVVAALATVALAMRLLARARLDIARIGRAGYTAAAWLIGIPAAFWLWQRMPV
jgi:hydrogenase/urease accessory protein HupE